MGHIFPQKPLKVKNCKSIVKSVRWLDYCAHCQSAPYGVQSAPYGVQSAPYGVQSAPYGVQSGLFPLEGQLELVDGAWSEGVARQAVWLSGLVPFAQAEAILQEIGQVNISRCSIWRRTEV